MRLGRVPVPVQLSRLALAGRTGSLQISGDHGGTVHLAQGMVTGAESRGTPDLASRLARWAAGTDAGPPDAVTHSWIVREAIADSTFAMLADVPRAARFTEGETASADGAGVMTAAELLTEVNRRHEVIRQLPAALTADTVVARHPRLGTQRVHVSAGQWSLLVDVNERATPRELAIGGGTSVFATTLQVFRLINLGLVAIVGGPPVERRTYSFIRATTS
jgi:hypothetical protein